MRKLLLSVALATATLAAVPAAAQHGQNDRHWNQNDRRDGYNHRGPSRQAVSQLVRQLAQVDNRIDRSARRGVISRREAIALNRQTNQIRNQLQRSGRNGLSGREFGALQVQVNRLEQRLRSERRDNDGRRG